MKANDYISESGFLSTPEMNFSAGFSEYVELHRSDRTPCRTVKAKRSGKWHVLKGLREEYRDKPVYAEMLYKEFDIVFHLDHPGIIRTFGKEYDEKIGPCIVMEYVDGITLTEFIRLHRADKGLIRKICTELLDAMAYFHGKQVIHRDLKPDNILITHNGHNVKVIDFGLSDTDDYAVLKQPAGTRRYAAPEQIAGKAPADNRADIYAFGMILIEMFAGEANISELKKLPRRYRNIATRCIETDRNKRYDKASEIRSQLEPRKIGAAWYVGAGLAAIGILTLLLRQPTNSMPSTITVTDTVTVMKRDTVWLVKRDTVYMQPVYNPSAKDYPIRIEKGSWEAELIDKAEVLVDSLYATFAKHTEEAKTQEELSKMVSTEMSDLSLKQVALRKRLKAEIPEGSYFKYEFENVFMLMCSKYYEEFGDRITKLGELENAQ